MNYVMHLLGWVAVQSVWQMLAIAFLLLVSLRLMRRASASQRYRCAGLHLAGAVGAVVLTLAVSHASVALGWPLASSDRLPVGWVFRIPDRPGVFLPALAGVWIGGIAVAQFLLAVRLFRLHRFLRFHHPASPCVTNIVEEMSRAIGLSQPPQVLCADVAFPMVAGERPAILIVPRAFEETWPQAEVRALLAHELAHIVRRDYSRNILQLFAVSLLWWHPAAWLIYAAIRHERECATDEHAVRHTCSAASLARALFRLAEAGTTAEIVSVAARSGGLADRLSRIAQPQENRYRRGLAHLAGVMLAALAVVVVCSSSNASKSESLTRAYASGASEPNTVFTIQARDPAGSFVVRMARGRVLAIELEHQPVPSDRVVQSGRIVTVMGSAGQEVLRLEVNPRGGFRWAARRAS